MFCKPPCPGEYELAPLSDASDDRPGLGRAQPVVSPHAFGRLVAPETAGPERGLPPASVRIG